MLLIKKQKNKNKTKQNIKQQLLQYTYISLVCLFVFFFNLKFEYLYKVLSLKFLLNKNFCY